jgi:beta-galactosidase
MSAHPILVSLILTTVALPPVPLAAAQEGPQSPADWDTYLEDPQRTGEGQEPHHAILRPFTDVAAAGADPRAETPYTRSLDGTWRFAYADRPADAPDFAESGDWAEVTVPHVWQQDGYDRPIYRNVPSEIAPYDPPRVPDDLNPTGSYLRTVDLPADWDGRRTLLRFEGVTSGYFVWVNGEYVGYDQGGMTPAEFDVTGAVHPGGNEIAVRVFRWSAGAYLENFDMWHLSGIYRSVWLYSVPATRIQDATIRTELADSGDGTLSAAVDVATAAGGTTGAHTVRATLRDPAGAAVATFSQDVEVTGDGGATTLSALVEQPARWTDETPTRYTLVLELIADAEVTHVTSEYLGFRDVSVAGEQVRVNGVPVDFRGVNRHEHDPRTGRHVPRSRMLEDVLLMKRHNVNAVRTSHYPNDPHWYDLADQYGLWLVDEVDVETHFRESCPNNCLADRPEWQAAMLDRFVGMVERDKNHPSVFMWSTGNEAGLGAAHFAMADYATGTDPTRLLYHQSNNPNGDAPYADVWGPRYPSPAGLQNIANTTNRPVLMGEWLHAMGNSLGHYEDMWRIIRDEPSLQGGFVWDWVDQGLERPLLRTPSRSGIPAYLVGNPGTVDGHDGGRALSLSGLDDWVEVYRDPALDLTGTTLTLDAWVRAPASYVGDFSIVAKGDRSYALEMADPDTIEFFVYDTTWHTVTADVPAGWAGAWHRVTGTYDGAALRIYVDGVELASTPHTGRIAWTQWPVNVGRNSEKHGDGWAGRTGVGEIDDVRVYDRALTAAELAGGADPADQALLALDFDEVVEDGTYLAYGSSPFLLNGVVLADRTPQPELAQMAYSHAWLRFEDVDAATGQVRLGNDYRFTDTSAVEVRWRLTQGARTLARGTVSPELAPGESTVLELPLPPPQARERDLERWLVLEAVLTEDTPWAPAGHVLASEQLAAGGSKPPTPRTPTSPLPLDLATEGTQVGLSGRDFSYVFDTGAGTFTQLRSRGRDLVAGGPRLDVWRAPIGNEWANWGQAEGWLFWQLGLDRLATTVDDVTVERTGPRTARITVEAHSEAPDVPGEGFAERYVYEVNSAGVLTISQQVEAYGDRMRALPWLPRVGLAVDLPQGFGTFEWYGRGPGESYPDRKDAEHIGVWRGPVDEQVFDYLPPQDTGNKADTAWAALSDGQVGLLAAGDLDVSVDRSAAQRDRAQYPFLLRDSGTVTFRVDKAVSGLGDTPVPTQPPYRVRADVPHEQTIVLRPLTILEASHGVGRGPLVPPEGTVLVSAPSQVVYDETGTAAVPVEVTNDTGGVAQDVTVRVELADGSVPPQTIQVGRLAAGESRTVEAELSWTEEVVARDTRLDLTIAWTAGQEARERSTSQQLRVTCAETPTTPAAVSFVDSEETVGEDGAAVNAIDGDPATIWHTQWQGGSPPHPHEIQLDLGQLMDVCALHYLPRQSGPLNGTVAGYEVYVSDDGQTWGEPVATGTFAATRDEKWVPFADTTGRFVRFVALSEVSGGPWTSAAELSVDGRPAG